MDRYQNSIEFFDRVNEAIPTASQTFSKSHYSFPKGAAPLFLESGKGCQVTDIDGNTYRDLVNGLLCVNLGYQLPEVNEAITRQLAKGISFSLPSRLEFEVAEKLIDIIPCAEQVRFGKNGTDVTSAAIRLARAVTGKEAVAVCGYHGWQDWYIGSTTRSLGVPQATQKLTHPFKFNDLASLATLLEKHSGQFAAVILEQMNVEEPTPEFLQGVRALCDQHQCLLVFDEIITGFRFDLGGAQSLFGVTPDLATFGKGLGNGMPISAIVGKKEFMKVMEDIFFSGTFGGETLSLAAASAVIDFIQQNDALSHLSAMGTLLADKVTDAAESTGANEWFKLVGHPSWKLWQLQDPDMMKKSVLIQLLAERGVLTVGSHNLSWSYREEDVQAVADAYTESFNIMQHADDLSGLLQGELLKPVFKVR